VVVLRLALRCGRAAPPTGTPTERTVSAVTQIMIAQQEPACPRRNGVLDKVIMNAPSRGSAVEFAQASLPHLVAAPVRWSALSRSQRSNTSVAASPVRG
jgi:hypothetical protein